METAIQEIERNMQVLQKMADTAKDKRQKTMFQNCLLNAAQMLANFREVERILNGNEKREG